MGNLANRTLNLSSKIKSLFSFGKYILVSSWHPTNYITIYLSYKTQQITFKLILFCMFLIVSLIIIFYYLILIFNFAMDMLITTEIMWLVISH